MRLPTPDTPGSILAQIARTAALVGVLGLLLYGAATVAAEWPGAHLLLAGLLALPLACLTSWQVLDGWRSGVFPLALTDAARREERPIAFWSAMAWTGLAALLLFGFGLWAGLKFLGLLG